MIKTKRQAEIVNLCKNFDTTCDVGCDHGIISVLLLLENKTKFVIATDISKKCVQKAEVLLKKYGLENRSSTRCANGLGGILPNENPEQIVIAGMGGSEIVEILSAYTKKSKYLALQPMKEIPKVREYLTKNGYKIEEDFVIEDRGKFYHLISASIGKQELSKSEINFGKATKHSEDYFLWLSEKEKKLEKILDCIPEENEKSNKILDCLKMIKNIKEKRL